jgi:ArsR family transcriptional regulator, arsenate/arsenite/antimonite-responsive transcriptional repressor
MQTKLALKTLIALAQGSRLAIFRHLVKIGPEGAFAGRIAEALDIAPAVLSFHLKELSHADLVQSEQDGRNVRYVANFSTMNALVGYLTENCCDGQPELCVPSRARAVKPKPRPRKRAA